MKMIGKMFVEFKSIFTTDNVLKENERHANIVTATTMFNLFLVILVSWILGKTDVVKVETLGNQYVLSNCFFGLFIPAILCFILKGDKKWLKFLLLGLFILTLGTIEHSISRTMAFLMVVPVILSARYYLKNFTISVSIFNFITFVVAALLSGKNYILNYQEIISSLLLYYVITFASVQISQSGKNMIEKQKEISSKGARIETELNLANSIQKHMLPSIFPPFPEHEELDIYASMTPAREVGGDFYDIFMINDRYVVINIADVSGKGIPAALFMMISKILIKNVSGIEKSSDQILNRVNKMLCDGNKEDIFVTAWLGILDIETGRLEFSNAGHNPPLIYSSKKGTFTYLKTDANMVMGGFGEASYEKHEIYIEPNDKIFLYTDGVTEAINEKNELYGEKRLKEFLDNHANLNSKESIELLKEDIDKFTLGTEQYDDITMLQLNFLGKVKNVSKEFDAVESNLNLVQEFILDTIKPLNLNKKDIDNILLVSEEIFVNIAKYAYKDIGKCNIKLYYDEKKFKCTFEDSGIPFNPLEHTTPDITKKEVGGLGIFMSKQIMDDVLYEYKDKKNILTIVKNIGGKNGKSN